MFGKRPWNFGLTKETSSIIKNATIKFSNRIKNGKLDTSNWGKKTPEACQKNFKGIKNKPKSEEHKKNISKSLKGYKRSKESCAK